VGNDRIFWQGTIGPDLGATDAISADNEIVISFLVSIPAALNTAENQATLDADLNDDGVIDAADGEVQVADADAVWTRRTLPSVPETGFQAGVVTTLVDQPSEKYYQDYGSGIWLEIPSLGIRTSIVGVPLVDQEWDVSWLSTQTGWLEGSAFPSHTGNSILTAHVYLPSGLPGPFVNLEQLSWDDRIIVHAYGQRFIYQVRSNQLIQPDDPRAVQHEDYPWLTLLTCKGFNEDIGTYNHRVMVRAVLIAKFPDYYR
jgi:LPXTG-site transpeptidase (sortase) family protein